MDRVRRVIQSEKIKLQMWLHSPRGRQWLLALLYLLLITLAEAVTTNVNPLWGVFLHGLVLITLVLHGSFVHRGTLRRFLILLSLAPMIRILSLSIPLNKLGLPIIYWYLVIGFLVSVAAFISSRVTELSGRRIGWSWRSLPTQGAIGLLGFGLGYVEYLILKPGPLAAYVTWEDVITASLILLIFTGVLEEYVFRGLMQTASMQILGMYGLVYVAVLFAILHLGYHSFSDLLFVLAVGLLFGWLAWKTYSLVGVSLAHGIANISLYVLFPLLLSSSLLPVASTGVPPIPAAVTLSSGQPTVASSATAVVEISPAEVIVDDGNPGFVYRGDNLWMDSTRGYGGSFRWTYAAQTYPDLVVSWLPELVECGWYQVEAFVPLATGLTGTARYRIAHRDGVSEIAINQEAYNGAWAPLGIFQFGAEAPSALQLSNLTGDDPKLLRWVAFDAARWIFIGPCEPPNGTPNQ
jgi:membrane protease YdiL (CAAX protease family)